MTFNNNWIAAQFGDRPAGDLGPGDSIFIDVELYNQHLSDFGDYDREVLMDADVIADPAGSPPETIESYDRVRLDAGRDQTNVISRIISHTIPNAESIEYRIEYEYEAPQQGEFSGSTSRSFELIDADAVTVESCSSGGEVTVGEETTVSVTVANANPVEADVDVTIEAGGTDVTETVRVPADGDATVDATFAFDEPGEYTPTVSVSEA